MKATDRFTSIKRIIRKLNPLVVAILRSPLHSMMSKAIMLITFTGRRSGKQYTTPVMYAQEDKTVYVFTGGVWWKNLLGGRRVTVRLRGRDHKGVAEPVTEDIQRIADGLRLFLTLRPASKGAYEVTLDENGQPKTDDLLRAARTTTMIQIRLESVY